MDYIKALEEEREKIMVFERELPLILQLVTQAIETYKKQHVGVGEEINGEGSFLEEFIPLRPCCSSSDEENNCNYENENVKVNGGINGDGDENKKKKPDWLQLARLWNQQPEHSKGDGVNKPVAMNAKGIRGAFHPFEREKIVNMAPASLTSNDNTNGVCGNGGSREEKEKKEKEGHSLRKVRRFWPTELHRRFLNALQELGGPHVAAPKQIRELMKVDGVTNDEVKSHLQSYLSKIREDITMNAKRIRGAFHPFEREKIVNMAPASSTSSDNTNGICGNGGSREEKEKEKEGHSRRKVRRCWSTELHRRFLNALQELGRLHAVTPKQIRVLMNVDGLTNNEVKSHLQKYRLHNKRPTASPAVEASSPRQPPQNVLVGGIWVPPPPEYATGTPLNTVRTPVPSLPSQITSQRIQHRIKQKINISPTGPLKSGRRRHEEDNKSDDAGEGTDSDSSNASSSNSQTTTASSR